MHANADNRRSKKIRRRRPSAAHENDEDFDRQVQEIQGSSDYADDHVIRICRLMLKLACPAILIIAVIASVIGLVTASHLEGLWAALSASAINVWFCLSTPACFLILSYVTRTVSDARSSFSLFISAAMGFEVVKLVITAVVLWLLGREDWFDPSVFGWTIFAGVIGALVSLTIGTICEH